MSKLSEFEMNVSYDTYQIVLMAGLSLILNLHGLGFVLHTTLSVDFFKKKFILNSS